MADAVNEFYVFDSSMNNIIELGYYKLASERLSGVQRGVANSMLHNRMYHQWSAIGYAIGEILVSEGINANDDDIDALTANLKKVLQTSTRLPKSTGSEVRLTYVDKDGTLQGSTSTVGTQNLGVYMKNGSIIALTEGNYTATNANLYPLLKGTGTNTRGYSTDFGYNPTKKTFTHGNSFACYELTADFNVNDCVSGMYHGKENIRYLNVPSTCTNGVSFFLHHFQNADGTYKYQKIIHKVGDDVAKVWYRFYDDYNWGSWIEK